MEAISGSDASGGRRVSEAVRASLAAVRAVQQAARARERRETLRARAFAATALLTFVAGIVIVGKSRGWHWHRTTAGMAGVVGMRPVGPLPASDQPNSPPLPTLEQAAVAESLDGAPSAAASTPASPANPADDALDTCGDAIAQRHLRTAAEACAEAFVAHPSDARLAMRVAKVQHARGHYQDAGEWASRAIALHTTDADAFVILAHAEARARHPAAARAAYRKYLAQAPRGWHASEARRALATHRIL